VRKIVESRELENYDGLFYQALAQVAFLYPGLELWLANIEMEVCDGQIVELVHDNIEIVHLERSTVNNVGAENNNWDV
jgi:hypothetical protein